MPNFLQRISLFPETRFWRVKGSAKVEDTFGGVASLLLFLVIGAVLIVKMVEVFNRSVVFVNTERTIGKTTFEGDITTIQNDKSLNPTMMAFKANSQHYEVTSSYLSKSSATVLQL